MPRDKLILKFIWQKINVRIMYHFNAIERCIFTDILINASYGAHSFDRSFFFITAKGIWKLLFDNFKALNLRPTVDIGQQNRCFVCFEHILWRQTQKDSPVLYLVRNFKMKTFLK